MSGLLGALALAGCGGADVETPTDEPTTGGEGSGGMGLMNEHHIGDEVVISGQPTPAQLESLADQGVRTVVFVHRPGFSDAEERQVLESRGVDYVGVELSGIEELDEAFAMRLAEQVSTMSSPTLLHCGDGNASAAVHALLRFLAGDSVDDAIASYDASGQTAWREPLQAQLSTLCEQELGGCAPEPEQPEVLETSDEVPDGYPTEEPPPMEAPAETEDAPPQ